MGARTSRSCPSPYRAVRHSCSLRRRRRRNPIPFLDVRTRHAVDEALCRLRVGGPPLGLVSGAEYEEESEVARLSNGPAGVSAWADDRTVVAFGLSGAIAPQ